VTDPQTLSKESRMFSPRFACLIMAPLGLLALAGCSKTQLGAPATVVNNPVFEVSGVPAAGLDRATTGPLVASQLVDGMKGGTVSVGSFRVEVPAGAFGGPATITLTQNDPSVLQCDVAIDRPGANQFQVPVALVAVLPNRSSLNDKMLWFDPALGAWREVGCSVDPDKLELTSQLWHFSTYAVSRAGW